MALIIKGTMPNCCGWCAELRREDNGVCWCNRMKKQISEVVPPYDKRMEWCPIIGEIPDRHGRLIDVDKLIASFRKWADAPIKRTNNEIADFLEEYSKDSTIVEATE